MSTPTEPEPLEPGARRSGVTWDEFAADVAEITEVDREEVQAETRIVEDLGLDSLALTELIVILVDEYDMWSLSRDLEDRAWKGVTVRSLFDEYLSRGPIPGPADGSDTDPPPVREQA